MEDFITFEEVIHHMEKEFNVSFDNEPNNFWLYIKTMAETGEDLYTEVNELQKENIELKNKLYSITKGGAHNGRTV